MCCYNIYCRVFFRQRQWDTTSPPPLKLPFSPIDWSPWEARALPQPNSLQSGQASIPDLYQHLPKVSTPTPDPFEICAWSSAPPCTETWNNTPDKFLGCVCLEGWGKEGERITCCTICILHGHVCLTTESSVHGVMYCIHVFRVPFFWHCALQLCLNLSAVSLHFSSENEVITILLMTHRVWSSSHCRQYHWV